MKVESEDNLSGLASEQKRVSDWVNNGLEYLFDHLSDITASDTLTQAMKYSVFSRGKRIRPFLVYQTLRALECDVNQGLPAACAVELLHTYSLIHDDLPAMDNDNLRRGKPTCHIAFGEATAILAGDALQALAFEVLANEQIFTQCRLSAKFRLQQIGCLAVAAGVSGMAGGQAEDMRLTKQSATLSQIKNIHKNKTGKLIRCSVSLATLAAQLCDSKKLNALLNYAEAIGLAFQIQDDILDLTGDSDILGKPRHSDLVQEKNTYASLLGVTKAREALENLVSNAVESLETIGNSACYLAQFAHYIMGRTS